MRHLAVEGRRSGAQESRLDSGVVARLLRPTEKGDMFGRLLSDASGMESKAGRERDATLVGVGSALTLIVLLVLQSFTGNGLFGTRVVTTTTTSTEQPDSFVSGLYAEHVLALESRNVSLAVGQYQGNATVTWESAGECQCGFLDGSYTGKANVTELMKQVLLGIVPKGIGSDVRSLTVENLTQSIGTEPDGRVVVNSSFVMVQQTVAFGTENSKITAQDYYAYSANARAWLIAREDWAFLSYSVQQVIAGFSSRA